MSWLHLGVLALAAAAPVAAAPAPVAGFSAADAEALAMPAAVTRLLRAGTWEATPAGFRIIALSHVADGCADQVAAHPAEAYRCVARARRLAGTLAPKGWNLARAGEHGLYSSHLNLILGDEDVVGAPHERGAHDALARALAARSLAEPTHHVPSFAGSALRWPADQSATLASLHRYDAAHGQRLADMPAGLWSAWLAAKATAAGLPWSEATGRARNARLPRGCALSFGIRYTAEVDPALAGRWWQLYREAYFVDGALVVGLREWPPGADLPEDADSGPIVVGVGAAATAFGQAAARAVGDETTARRLAATSVLVGRIAQLNRSLARAQRSTLAQAILFQAAHQPRR
jgi:hypothetical protein